MSDEAVATRTERNRQGRESFYYSVSRWMDLYSRPGRFDLRFATSAQTFPL